MAKTASQIGKSNVQRGKAYERKIAKLLTEWSGMQFRRRRIEGRDVQTIDIDSTSDVIPVGFDINCTIEVKTQMGFSINALFKTPNKALFTKFYHQSSYDATLLSKIKKRVIYPTVFFRPQANTDWTAISYNFFIDKQIELNFPHILYDHYKYINPISCDVSHGKKPKMVEINLDPVIFCSFEDFSKNININHILVGEKCAAQDNHQGQLE